MPEHEPDYVVPVVALATLIVTWLCCCPGAWWIAGRVLSPEAVLRAVLGPGTQDTGRAKTGPSTGAVGARASAGAGAQSPAAASAEGGALSRKTVEYLRRAVKDSAGAEVRAALPFDPTYGTRGRRIVGLTRVERFVVPAGPKSLEWMPDGRRVEVNSLYADSVSFVDSRTYKVLKVVSIPGQPVEADFTDVPGSKAIGRYAWVSLYEGNAVAVIDTKTYEVVDRIPTGVVPKVVTASPDGHFIYVANWKSNSVTVIGARSLRRVKDVPVGNVPRGIVFSPDGRYAYVANMGGSTISKIDVRRGHAVVGSLEVASNPRHLVITRDGRYIYVSNNALGQVRKVDVMSWRVAGVADVGNEPRTIELVPNEGFVIVTNYQDDTVGVVDTSSMRQLFTVPTAPHPVGAAVSPDGRWIWIANYTYSTITVYRVSYR